MRTTIDIPDDILRRAKAVAALRGMKLKDLVAQLLDAGLRGSGSSQVPKTQRRKLPVMIPAAGRKIPILTNAELFGILDEEDDKMHGRFS